MVASYSSEVALKVKAGTPEATKGNWSFHELALSTSVKP